MKPKPYTYVKLHQYWIRMGTLEFKSTLGHANQLKLFPQSIGSLSYYISEAKQTAALWKEISIKYSILICIFTKYGDKKFYLPFAKHCCEYCMCMFAVFFYPSHLTLISLYALKCKASPCFVNAFCSWYKLPLGKNFIG